MCGQTSQGRYRSCHGDLLKRCVRCACREAGIPSPLGAESHELSSGPADEPFHLLVPVARGPRTTYLTEQDLGSLSPGSANKDGLINCCGTGGAGMVTGLGPPPPREIIYLDCNLGRPRTGRMVCVLHSSVSVRERRKPTRLSVPQVRKGKLKAFLFF